MKWLFALVFTGAYLGWGYFLSPIFNFFVLGFEYDHTPFLYHGFFIISVATLWYLESKSKDLLTFLAGAFVIGVLIILGTLVSPWLEDYQMERRIENTEVFDVTDEVLLSPSGNPIGIRMKYSMRFPDDRDFWNPLSFWYTQGSLSTNVMHVLETRVEPLPVQEDASRVSKYETGQIYTFTVDSIPIFMSAYEGGMCINRLIVENLLQRPIQDSKPTSLTIKISNTNFRKETSEYSFREFYESAVKEGFPICAWEPQAK